MQSTDVHCIDAFCARVCVCSCGFCWLIPILTNCFDGVGASPLVLKDLSTGHHQVIVAGQTHDGVEGVSLVEFSFEEGEKMTNK